VSSTAVADGRIEQIVAAFENATIDPDDFDHEAHLLVGWRYLQDLSLLDSINRFTGALKRLTRKLGVPAKYHETITWFYLIKIAERCRGQAATDWPAFKAANPDLLQRNPALIRQYYSGSLLSSETARRLFVFPDLGA
jgi:hypothetical protein